jgi:preprotein translocase subunit YajC
MSLYAIAASVFLAQGPTSGLVTFLPLVVIMVIFYVLLRRPCWRRSRPATRW